MHDLTCDEVQDAAPQFALDILEPSARADVSAHLMRCPGCRHDVSGMQESAARLLDLRDEPANPVLSDDGPLYLTDPDDDPGPLSSRRRRLRMVITLTTVAALVIATALGPELSRPVVKLPVPLATGQLMEANRAVGTVNFYARHVPTVELAVRGLSATGRVTCVLVGLDGKAVALGSFKLDAGTGYWGNSTPINPDQVAGFDLVDSTGHLVAAASVS